MATSSSAPPAASAATAAATTPTFVGRPWPPSQGGSYPPGRSPWWSGGGGPPSLASAPRPVLGHLTTTWTPPAGCLAAGVLGATPPWSAGWAGATCAAQASGVRGLVDATDCWPPRTANAPGRAAGAFLVGWGFYSPGTVCPSGYTTACRAAYGEDVTGGWQLQFTLTAGETAAGCCPSGGYSCYYTHPNAQGESAFAQTCLLLATSTMLEVAPCQTNSAASGITTSATLPYQEAVTTESTTSTITVQTFTALAPLIQINWRAEDLAAGTWTATDSSSSASTTSDGGSGNPLSGGAIAGIVIGAVVALAGVAFGVFWFMRRRGRKDLDKIATGKGQPDHHPKEEPSPFRRAEPAELSAGEYHAPELPSADPALRMPGQAVVGGRFLAEVPG